MEIFCLKCGKLIQTVGNWHALVISCPESDELCKQCWEESHSVKQQEAKEMNQDRYYYDVCKKCAGFKECEPRNEENIRDCRTRANKGNGRNPPIKRNDKLMKTLIKNSVEV